MNYKPQSFSIKLAEEDKKLFEMLKKVGMRKVEVPMYYGEIKPLTPCGSMVMKLLEKI